MKVVGCELWVVGWEFHRDTRRKKEKHREKIVLSRSRILQGKFSVYALLNWYTDKKSV